LTDVVELARINVVLKTKHVLEAPREQKLCGIGRDPETASLWHKYCYDCIVCAVCSKGHQNLNDKFGGYIFCD